MPATLKQLEKRVGAVEKKLAKFMKEPGPAPIALDKKNNTSPHNGTTAPQQTAPKVGWAAIAKPGSWIAKQLAMQPEISRLADEVFAQMGITGEPTVHPKVIRDKMIERGVRPEDNEFTRELIRIREET